MARRETGTAYLLWCASLLGVCGLQRFYMGQSLVGSLYLLTFGFCGVAQLIDLFLIPGLVERSNRADALAIATGRTASESWGHQQLTVCSEPSLTLEQKFSSAVNMSQFRWHTSSSLPVSPPKRFARWLKRWPPRGF